MSSLSHAQIRKMQSLATIAGGHIYYDAVRNIYAYVRSKSLGGRILVAPEIRSRQQYRCNTFVFTMPEDFLLLERCLKHNVKIYSLHQRALKHLLQPAR